MADSPTTEQQAFEEGSRLAIEKVLTAIIGMDPVVVIPFMCSTVSLTVSFLRADGTKDQFVRELLEAALESLKTPPPFSLKDMRVN